MRNLFDDETFNEVDCCIAAIYIIVGGTYIATLLWFLL